MSALAAVRSWAPTSSILKSAPENQHLSLEDVQKWMQARGLPAPAEEPSADRRFVFRTVHYPNRQAAEHDPAKFVTQSFVPDEVAQHLLTLEPFPSVPATKSGLFAVQIAPRGLTTTRPQGDKGIFALQQIDAGTVIVAERPTLVVPQTLWLGGTDMKSSDILRTMVGRLPRGERGGPGFQEAAVMELCNVRPQASCVEEGIMRSNGIGIQLGPSAQSGMCSALFTTLSRCNHDCAPNATLVWNPTALVMTLRAVRTIMPKEEITIAYIDVLLPAAERIRTLKTLYNFTCFCAFCALGTRERAKSDESRASLRAWVTSSERTTFKNWIEEMEVATARTPPADLGKMNALLKVFIGEKLQAVRAPRMELVDTLARIHGALGREDFKKMVKGAIKVWEVDAGDSEAVRRRIAAYKEWVANAASFKYWPKRA